MDRSEDLLEEPLFMDGHFVRRWDELARLPRPDGGPDVLPSAVGRQERHVHVPAPRAAEVGRRHLTWLVD